MKALRGLLTMTMLPLAMCVTFFLAAGGGDQTTLAAATQFLSREFDFVIAANRFFCLRRQLSFDDENILKRLWWLRRCASWKGMEREAKETTRAEMPNRKDRRVMKRLEFLQPSAVVPLALTTKQEQRGL